jgi:tryptophan 2,3-dioxygenase
MKNSTIASQNEMNREIWFSLRQAISKSSGFQSWQQERDISSDIELEQQVRRYLKETLETLAY